MEAIPVPIDQIILDQRLQMRASMDMNLIDEYADSVLDLPPARIVRAEGKMFLTDGWHTYYARKKAHQCELPCYVRDGTFYDAMIEAASANATHGKKRSPEDKRRAVATIIVQMPSKSDREVATICRVSHSFVGTVRAENGHSDGALNGGGQSGKGVSDGGFSSTPEKPKIQCPACARKARVGQELPKRCKDCDDLRKSSKPPKPPKAPPAPPPSLEDTDSPPPPLDDGIVRDDAGTVVPERLLKAFALRPIITEAAKLLSKASKACQEVENSPTWQHMKAEKEAFAKYRRPLQDAAKAYRENCPSIVCPDCAGDGGPCCGDRGFLSAAKAKAKAGTA